VGAALRGLGKDVLLIAHDKEDKDGDTRIVRPDIVGGSYAEVMKVADFVGYLQMSGKDRVLDFNPTDRWIGKNPAGWAPFKLPPVAKAQEFMAELFDEGPEALGGCRKRRRASCAGRDVARADRRLHDARSSTRRSRRSRPSRRRSCRRRSKLLMDAARRRRTVRQGRRSCSRSPRRKPVGRRRPCGSAPRSSSRSGCSCSRIRSGCRRTIWRDPFAASSSRNHKVNLGSAFGRVLEIAAPYAVRAAIA
jgi:hypothetical protein